MNNIFLGYPPENIIQWIKDHSKPPKPDAGPLCFTAQVDGSYVSMPDLTASLQYSTDNQATWTEWDGSTINLNNGEKVYIKALNDNDMICTTFQMEGLIAASGNIQYLLTEDGSRMDVPAECFMGLFQDCTSLTQAPELPATTLDGSCYELMFYGCTSLTKAPELPATELKQGCYSSMFEGCTSLTQAPELPATTLGDGCYSCMFIGCTSLTQAPKLPATTLANYCYESMFSSCFSLTQAPSIKTYMSDLNAFEDMLNEFNGYRQTWGQLTSCNWPDLSLDEAEAMVLNDWIFGFGDENLDVRINITCKDGSGVAYYDAENYTWVFER